MIDLKETKRIKELLETNPKNYQDIINQTALAVCITNKQANFVAVNDNYLKLYGFKREELVGNSFTAVVPVENRPALKKYHDQFFVDKYEILRKWIVVNRKNQKMEIFADAGYNDKINDQPNKITLIQFQKFLDDEVKKEDYANSSI